MNIQTQELPLEVAAQTLAAERATQAVRDNHERTVPVSAGLEARPEIRPDARPADHSDGHTNATGHLPETRDQEEAKALSRDEARKLIDKAQDYFKDKGVTLHFKMLNDSDELQVEVVDADSNKVIRKFPQDELLKLSDNLKRMGKGFLDKAV